MATITALTADRMLAIEAESIVGGAVNGAGHLILTRHDGITMDAGVALGAVGAKGDPGIWLPINSFVASDPASAFAPGVTTFLSNPGTGWPSTGATALYGCVQTIRPYNASPGGTIQYWSGYQTGDTSIYYRQWNYNAVAWNAWQKIIVDDGLTSYRYQQTLIFTSSGTFTKASYPGFKAVRARAIGAGGAGGGAPVATTAGNHSQGGGGGGGGYAERFIIDTSLATSISVTVGAGGAPVSGGTGGAGGQSAFSSLCVANGGSGGGTATNQVLMVAALGGQPGAGFSGDFLASGSPGEAGTGNASLGIGGMGGSSMYGGGGAGSYTGAGAGSTPGADAPAYGGGGGGAQGNSNAPIRSGGAGGPGVVIVEIYV